MIQAILHWGIYNLHIVRAFGYLVNLFIHSDEKDDHLGQESSLFFANQSM